MTEKDILISDLNDISEILNNNGYGGWCKTIRKAVALLKEQEAIEPIPYHRSDGTIFKYGCRQCGTKIFKMDLFCRHCGRPVKWE